MIHMSSCAKLTCCCPLPVHILLQIQGEVYDEQNEAIVSKGGKDGKKKGISDFILFYY